MATEKQIAANRANAQKSTGPKTAAGRLKSSRNALRHGLSCPLPLDPAMSAKVEAIAQALTGEGASQDQVTSAAEFAQAQLELLRIRAIRAETMRDTDLKLGSTQDLRRLLALDRYLLPCYFEWISSDWPVCPISEHYSVLLGVCGD